MWSINQTNPATILKPLLSWVSTVIPLPQAFPPFLTHLDSFPWLPGCFFLLLKSLPKAITFLCSYNLLVKASIFPMSSWSATDRTCVVFFLFSSGVMEKLSQASPLPVTLLWHSFLPLFQFTHLCFFFKEHFSFIFPTANHTPLQPVLKIFSNTKFVVLLSLDFSR